MKDKIKVNSDSTDQDLYADILQQALAEIRSARTEIVRQVNRSTNSVYWNLGKLLVEKQSLEGYGSGVVKQLSIDLKTEFPDMGVSPRNLWDMKRFYERWHLADQKLRQLVAVLPWGHNLLLLNKVPEDLPAEFYAKEAISKGWSRDLLLNAHSLSVFISGSLRARPVI